MLRNPLLIALTSICASVPAAAHSQASEILTPCTLPGLARHARCRAYLGDWTPIVEGVLANARGADDALSFGLLFAITCSEDVAFMSEEEIVRSTQGASAGNFRARQQQAACEHWPRAPLPPDYRQPVQSSAPAMFVSGDIDAASPLWFTERVARGFPNRVEIVLRGRGHTETNDCVARLYERFVQSGTSDRLQASCAPERRPPFRIH